MITDKIVNGLNAYLAANAGTDLATATFTVRDDDSDLTYPSLVISEDGAPEAHDVLRDTWTAGITVILRTVPEDTTEATHQAMTADLEGLLRDRDAILCELGKTMTAFDADGGQGYTEPDGNYRATTFELQVVASDSLLPVS